MSQWPNISSESLPTTDAAAAVHRQMQHPHQTCKQQQHAHQVSVIMVLLQCELPYNVQVCSLCRLWSNVTPVTRHRALKLHRPGMPTDALLV